MCVMTGKTYQFSLCVAILHRGCYAARFTASALDKQLGFACLCAVIVYQFRPCGLAELGIIVGMPVYGMAVFDKLPVIMACLTKAVSYIWRFAGVQIGTVGIMLGMHTVEHVVSACEMAADFTPMTAGEMRALNERLAPSSTASTLHYLRPDYVDDGGWRTHLA